MVYGKFQIFSEKLNLKKKKKNESKEWHVLQITVAMMIP